MKYEEDLDGDVRLGWRCIARWINGGKAVFMEILILIFLKIELLHRWVEECRFQGSLTQRIMAHLRCHMSHHVVLSTEQAAPLSSH